MWSRYEGRQEAWRESPGFAKASRQKKKTEKAKRGLGRGGELTSERGGAVKKVFNEGTAESLKGLNRRNKKRINGWGGGKGWEEEETSFSL